MPSSEKIHHATAEDSLGKRDLQFYDERYKFTIYILSEFQLLFIIKIFSDESPDEDSPNHFAFRRGLVVIFIRNHAGLENLFSDESPRCSGKSMMPMRETRRGRSFIVKIFFRLVSLLQGKIHHTAAGGSLRK